MGSPPPAALDSNSSSGGQDLHRHLTARPHTSMAHRRRQLYQCHIAAPLSDLLAMPPPGLLASGHENGCFEEPLSPSSIFIVDAQWSLPLVTYIVSHSLVWNSHDAGLYFDKLEETRPRGFSGRGRISISPARLHRIFGTCSSHRLVQLRAGLLD